MSTQGKVVAFEKTPEFLRECASRYAQSDPLRSLDFLHRAREIAPEDAQTLLAEAELLSEMGCALESTLLLARVAAQGELPSEACYGLASNLVVMGLLEPGQQALRLYLSREGAGENAESARHLISLLEMHRQTQPRRMRHAIGLSSWAVWLIRTGCHERARALLERALACAPDSRQLLIMKIKCDLYTGREQEARGLASYLGKNEFEGDFLTLALVLSEKEGNEELVDQLLDGYLEGNTDPELTLLQLRVYLNQGCGDRIHRLLPRVLREAPYDRSVLHAAAMDALKYGGSEETARWYWQCMQRIRPEDAVAAHCLAEADADGPWTLKLSEARTQALRENCLHPGESLLKLARWAVDAQESEAFSRLLEPLSQSSESEAEIILREALAHPGLSEAVKRQTALVLAARGAKEPYLWVSPSGAYLLRGGELPDKVLPDGLNRLLSLARDSMGVGCPEALPVLERLWKRLTRCGNLRTFPIRDERMMPVLLALALQEAGYDERVPRLALQYGWSERRLRFDAARLGVLLKTHERGNTHEAD